MLWIHPSYVLCAICRLEMSSVQAFERSTLSRLTFKAWRWLLDFCMLTCKWWWWWWAGTRPHPGCFPASRTPSVPRRGSRSTAPDQDKALIENEWMNDFHVLVSVVLWSIVLLMACLKSLIGFYLTKTLWIKAFDKWANILKCTWVEILPLHALIIDNKLDVLYMHSHSTND